MSVVDARVAPTRVAIDRSRGLARGRTWILVAGDLCALVVAYAITYLAADRISPPAIVAPTWLLVMLGVAAGPIWIAVLTAYHLYDNDQLRISVSSFDEVRDVFHGLAVGSLGFLLAAQALRRIAGWSIFSAVEAAVFLAAALVLIPAIRGTLRTWALPKIMQRQRALIVGTGPDARLVHRKLKAHPEFGLDVVGFLADEAGSDEVPGRLLGNRDDIAWIVEEHEIDRVLIASEVGGHEETLDLVRAVRRPDVQVSIVPRYFEIFTSNATLDDIEGMPVVTLPPMRLGRSSHLLKRSFDIVVASALLLVLAPVMAVTAIAVRLDSSGPALFRQLRRGRGGGVFHIVKFRTMLVGAEGRRAEVLHLNGVDGPLFKAKGGDPRVTKVGAILRRTSLDELPQLWNVLRGEMSLVGPRPFVVYEADQITGWASRRLDMTPGITGLWQVLGRNDMPFNEMVKLDYLYVTNWSLWWDLKILCQTIPAVFAKRGAY